MAALEETATFAQNEAPPHVPRGRRIADEYDRQEAEAQADREAKEARARLEAEAEMYLSRVLPYL
jgi:hypothetical protein